MGILPRWAMGIVTVVCLADGPYLEVLRQDDVLMPARDGVRLATDIYRPALGGRPVAGPMPVLLHRTPYDKRGTAQVTSARYFAQHGYIAVVQDTRGRHRSGGVFSKYYKYDTYDGYDAVEWAARLPGADGRVGMWGTSYAAHTQADAAKLDPPHLKALVLNMGGMANAWNHSVRNGGAFELGRQLTWAWEEIILGTRDPAARALLTRERAADWYSALPLRRGLSPLAADPAFEGWFLEEATHSDGDAFWKGPGLNWEEYYPGTADVPMLHVSGWYDIYLGSAIQNFTRLSRIKRSPMRLLLGPWTHHGNARDYAGDVSFGPASVIPDFDTGFHLAWFDRHLKGRPAPPADPPVRYFLMGGGDGRRDPSGRLRHGGVWREADQWPPRGVRFTRFHLQPDGGLDPAPPAAGPGSVTFTFDPARPVPTLGGGVSHRLLEGAFHQRERPGVPGCRPPYLPLKARRDVLVFQTPPLERDVEVAGPIEVILFAASTGVDTDFTVKLLDVYPPSPDYPEGFDLNLTDGILRTRYRDDSPVQKLMRPGTVYRLVLRPFATANRFGRGHRIRLDISSSNFPRFDVNPNTGEPLGANRRTLEVDNTVHHSAQYPSHIVLPILHTQ